MQGGPEAGGWPSLTRTGAFLALHCVTAERCKGELADVTLNCLHTCRWAISTAQHTGHLSPGQCPLPPLLSPVFVLSGQMTLRSGSLSRSAATKGTYPPASTAGSAFPPSLGEMPCPAGQPSPVRAVGPCSCSQSPCPGSLQHMASPTLKEASVTVTPVSLLTCSP